MRWALLGVIVMAALAGSTAAAATKPSKLNAERAVQNALHARIYFIPKVGSVKTFVTPDGALHVDDELNSQSVVICRRTVSSRYDCTFKSVIYTTATYQGKARVAFGPAPHVVVTAATCVTPEQGETTCKKYPLRKG
jgi:hypothetical protein